MNKPSGESFESPAVDSSDPRIQQATYNILADGGVAPLTPAGVIVDGNEPPQASFTVTPNPAATGTEVTFDASGSKDPDGTIAKYEWDLDGNGTYETSSGASPTVKRSYSSAGELTVRVRVTDNSGATEEAVRTLKISTGSSGNIFPTAAFTISPNPASPGTLVTFNATGSSDPDGTIAKYEWDLDGNGTYETSTGSTPTVSKAYTEAGTRQVGLKVTDNGGGTGTTTHVLIVGTGSPYSGEVLNTPGLIDYWRLGESSGTSLADAEGTHPATAQGGVTLGTPGAIEADPNTAATFDGGNRRGERTRAQPLRHLSADARILAQLERLREQRPARLRVHPELQQQSGGFLVDPNAGELGGKFGVGIGREGSRNNAYFTRPSAGVWHHYAIVMNTQAAAAQQIIPYVDGAAGQLRKAQQRHRGRQLRQLDPLLHVAGGQLAVRQRRARRGRALQPGAEPGRDRRALPGEPQQPLAERIVRSLRQPSRDQHPGDLQRRRLQRPRRLDRQIRMGPRRQWDAMRPTPARRLL